MKSHKTIKHISANSLSAQSMLRRLPALKQLNLSQSTLNQCHPIWETWAKRNLAAKSYDETSLSHFQEGALTIHCSNATIATQIKQQQNSLLTLFENHELSQIKQITVRIFHKPNTERLSKSESKSESSQSKYEGTSYKATSKATSKPAHRTPNENAIKAIQAAHKSASTTAVADSLQRLINTIEKINS